MVSSLQPPRKKALRVPLVALTGRAGTGKTTLAKHLSSTHDCVIASFASPLKAAIATLFGFDSSRWDDREFRSRPLAGGFSPREIIQRLGTDFIRNEIASDTMIRRMNEKFRVMSGVQQGPTLVIDDLRFDNEAVWVWSVGGVVIEVKRPDQPRLAHSSEDGIAMRNLIHRSIVNDSDVESMHKKLVEFVG